MSTQIVMPQLGESVAEGVIGKWLKQEGDPIAKDEPIVEVVTDKVNAEIPSPVAGILQQISAQEGDTVAVGEEIAVIGDRREAPAQPEDRPSPDAAPVASTAHSDEEAKATARSSGGLPSDAPSEPVSSSLASATTPVGSSPSPRSEILDLDQAPDGSRRVVRSSPLVQRLASEHDVDLTRVEGTGIGGRVSKKDILQFIESAGAASTVPLSTPAPVEIPAPVSTLMSPPRNAPAQEPPIPPSTVPAERKTLPPASQPAGPNEEYLPISPVRRMIAEHMVKSKYTLPHATSMIEIDMTPVVQFRDAHKTSWQEAQGISLSFMSFVALATVEALRQYPLVNSEWADDKIILKKNINLGLAVAAQNGLIVPNIKNADRLSLGGFAHAINDLTVRARNGKLTPDDVAGGTFTLNNTGAIGSVWSVSIINYPQAGILSADAIVKRLWVMPDDSIAIRSMMNLCMSFDHRTLDGATVAGFMQFIRRRMETWPAGSPL